MSTPEELRQAYLKVRERIIGPPVRIRNSLHTLEWLEREHMELAEKVNRVCKWRPDPNLWHWHGACGAMWTFERNDPVDNEMYYCPKCGGKVEVTA